MVTQPTDIQEVVGALDTECGGNKMSHQTIASGHLLPIKSFYESSLAQYREDNVSGTIKASGGVAGGGSETFLAQPIPIHDQATRHAGKNGEKTMGKGNGLGIGQPGDPMNTLTKGDHHAVAYNIAPGKGALKDDIHVTDAYISKTIDASGSNPAMHQGGAAILQPIAFHPTQDPITSTDGTTHGLGCGSSGGQASIAVAQPIPFDTTQITSPSNYSKPQAGDPCHPLAAGAHPPAIAQPIAFEPGKLKRLGYGDAEPGLSPALRAEAGDNQVAVAQPLVLMDQGGGVMNVQTDGTVGTLRRETHGHEPVVLQPIPIDSMNHLGRSNENHSMGDFVPGAPSYTLTKGHSHAVAHPVAFDTFNQTTSDVNQTIKSPVGGANESIGTVLAPSLTTNNPSRSPQASEVTQQVNAVYQTSMAVRRLTPVECERLQGFPDGYTNIPWRKAAESPDGPRYKALGNSWAVPVVAWIGKRIDAAIKGAKHD
jgi:hypothetical protein